MSGPCIEKSFNEDSLNDFDKRTFFDEHWCELIHSLEPLRQNWNVPRSWTSFSWAVLKIALTSYSTFHFRACIRTYSCIVVYYFILFAMAVSSWWHPLKPLLLQVFLSSFSMYKSKYFPWHIQPPMSWGAFP